MLHSRGLTAWPVPQNTTVIYNISMQTDMSSLPQAVGKQRGLAGVVGGEESWGVEHLCTALSHSLSLWRHISNKSPPSHAHISTHLQLACHVTVSLAHCLQRVLAHCDGAVVPLPCLAPVVSDVVLNGVVMLARPRLHRKLSTFLEKVDPSNFQVPYMYSTITY